MFFYVVFSRAGQNLVPEPSLEVQEALQEWGVSTRGYSSRTQPRCQRFHGLQLSSIASGVGKQ